MSHQPMCWPVKRHIQWVRLWWSTKRPTTNPPWALRYKNYDHDHHTLVNQINRCLKTNISTHFLVEILIAHEWILGVVPKYSGKNTYWMFTSLMTSYIVETEHKGTGCFANNEAIFVMIRKRLKFQIRNTNDQWKFGSYVNKKWSLFRISNITKE